MPTQLAIPSRAELNLARKRKHFDHSFWTDGSVTLDGYGTAACIEFTPTDVNPSKRLLLNDGTSITTIMTSPVGFVDASCLPEKVALDMVPQIIEQFPNHYENSNIFVGSDSQSSLMALQAGALRDYHHSCTGYNWSATYDQYLDVANKHNLHVYLQWVPSHVGLEPNEEANDIVRDYSNSFGQSIQTSQPIELKAIKSSVNQCLWEQWIANNVRARCGSQYEVCELTRSKLSRRRGIPRALQSLHSRWRVGEVESCGVYPRCMGWLEDPRCRFCGYPCETTVHLLGNALSGHRKFSSNSWNLL